MLLETLADFPTVEAAAAEMAGNWETWRSFVWFGSKDVPDSGDVMLGYLVNNEHTLRQLTNLEFVRAELKEFWGDMTEGLLVGDFGSSFWGDPDVLNGLMMRVVEDGRITEPFRRLYEIAKDFAASTDDLIIDRPTFERVRKREMTAYAHRYLEYECRKKGVPFNADLVESVTRTLIMEEVDFDNDDLDHEIDEVMGWAEPVDD